MPILVHFKNNTFAFVPHNELDELIASDDIIAFRRQTGWVELGKDPLRGQSAAAYQGPERRGTKAVRNCLTCLDLVDSMCKANNCQSRISTQAKSFKIEGGGLHAASNSL